MGDWDLDPPPREKARVPEGGGATAPGPPSAPPTGRAPAPTKPGASRRRVRTIVGWVAAGVLLLLAGAVIGFFIARSQMNDETAQLAEARAEQGRLAKALTEAQERSSNYYRANETLKAQLESVQTGGQSSTSTTVTGSGSEPGSLGTSYSDGVYLVGEDIAAGTYDGVVDGEVGYWARLSATDGTVSAIVANALERGPFVLTIIPSDRAVELRGVRITAR
jgi:hypothetical protein